MKKLILAMSVITLTFITSCSNSNEDVTPIQESNAKFSNKTTAKGEELPKLTPEQEKEMIDDALDLVKQSRYQENAGNSSKAVSRATILCHTNYNNANGHACVYNNGYLVHVIWQPEQINGPGGSVYINYENTIFSGQTTSNCSC